MSILYIDKSDCVIGKQDNRITVKYKDGMVRTIPVESIDGITLLGHAQVTTQCIQECLKKGISLSYFQRVVTILAGCLQQVILKLLFKESRQVYMTNHSH